MTTLLEKLFYFLSPHDCIFCGNEGNMVCGACRGELIDDRVQRCHVCFLPSLSFEPCEGCQPKTALAGLYALGAHEDELREVVSRLKFTGARQVASDLAPVLAELLQILPEDIIITHLPTVDQRVRARGFDQAALLAQSLAKEVDRPYASLLRRQGKTRQVGTNKEVRKKQARRMFRMLRPNPHKGRPIILVDDVVTTGASMESAAQILRQNGATEVYGVAIAVRIG